MIADVQNALNGIVGSATILQNAAGAGRVFELYVMTGIGRALQARGYDVWVQRSDGSRILPTDADRRFIQRGGAPTGIAPGRSGPTMPARSSSAAGPSAPPGNCSTASSSRGAARPTTRLTSRLSRKRSRKRFEARRPAASREDARASRSNAKTSAQTAASMRCAHSSPGFTISHCCAHTIPISASRAHRKRSTLAPPPRARSIGLPSHIGSRITHPQRHCQKNWLRWGRRRTHRLSCSSAARGDHGWKRSDYPADERRRGLDLRS